MFLQAGLVVLSLAAIAQGDKRVHGGRDAPNHKYPYLVSFRAKRGHFCGGSILNKHWILTAAHCVVGLDPKSFTISAGTNYLTEDGIVYRAQSYVVPEEYKDHFHNDIALVRVKNDIVFSDFVKPLKLTTKDLKDYNKTAVFAGWGYTQWTRYKPSIALQEIDFNLLTNEECKKIYPDLTKRHMCTLNKPGEGVCFADSGSPLVVDGVQVGIASYLLLPCGGHPEAWTRVFSYKDWILENMKSHDAI